MLERIGEGSDGLATVFPAMLNCFDRLARARLLENKSGLRQGGERFRWAVCRRSGGFPYSTLSVAQFGTLQSTIISLAESGVSPDASRAAEGRRLADQ
mgnify:CR=1 FL=1